MLTIMVNGRGIPELFQIEWPHRLKYLRQYRGGSVVIQVNAAHKLFYAFSSVFREALSAARALTLIPRKNTSETKMSLVCASYERESSSNGRKIMHRLNAFIANVRSKKFIGFFGFLGMMMLVACLPSI